MDGLRSLCPCFRRGPGLFIILRLPVDPLFVPLCRGLGSRTDRYIRAQQVFISPILHSFNQWLERLSRFGKRVFHFRRHNWIHLAHNHEPRDIATEVEKLLWADAVIFQFPVWWFGFPAILKGWVDRVFAYKFAYGYKNAGNTYRYGDGALAGKRTLLSVTVGGPEVDYGPRGINGPLEHLLFPITHGTLFFPGIDVLPTFAVYGTASIDEASLEAAKRALERRMVRLFVDDPIPFRRQNGGDYPDRHTLAPHIAADITGIPAHIASDRTGAPFAVQALESVKD